MARWYWKGWEFMAKLPSEEPNDHSTSLLPFFPQLKYICAAWSCSRISAYFTSNPAHEKITGSKGLGKHYQWLGCKKQVWMGQCQAYVHMDPEGGYDGRRKFWTRKLPRCPHLKVETKLSISQGSPISKGRPWESKVIITIIIPKAFMASLFRPLLLLPSNLANYRKHISSHCHLFL